MGALTLVVDPDDPTPPYEQLRRQVVRLIDDGDLVAGDRLPPLRQLAGDLGVAVGTVARAYRQLESAGLLVTRRGGGTRIAADATGRGAPMELVELASDFVAAARQLGATDDQVLGEVRRAL